MTPEEKIDELLSQMTTKDSIEIRYVLQEAMGWERSRCLGICDERFSEIGEYDTFDQISDDILGRKR